MSPRIKLLIAIVVPILTGAVVGTVLVSQWAMERVEARANHFGNALVSQVALTVTDPLLQEDVLSLNVILSDLIRRGDVSFASVYRTDNRLVAQAGRRGNSFIVFSQDVTFQNTSAGYVQIGMSRENMTGSVAGILASAIIVWAVILVAIGGLVWFYGDLLYLWFTPGRRKGIGATSTLSAADEPAPEPIAAEQTILVVKVRPARQLDAHYDAIMGAIALYGGDAEITDGDDVVVMFRRSEQLVNAACTAQLVAALMQRVRGKITVKSGMHVGRADDEEGEIGKARKHATYLASIADNQLLASRRIFTESQSTDRVAFEEFHSSLTPDGEVYVLTRLGDANRKLIDNQAEQLA